MVKQVHIFFKLKNKNNSLFFKNYFLCNFIFKNGFQKIIAKQCQKFLKTENYSNSIQKFFQLGFCVSQYFLKK